MLIAKIYGFNSLSKVVFVRIEALYRPQKEVVGLVCSLIESSNLSEVQKALKRDSTFKVFTIEYIQDMVKNEMNAVISNPKFSTSSSKISPNAMEGFSMSIIDNKYARSMPILRFILRVLASSIGVPSHSSCWGMENPNINNESNKSKSEIGIKLEDEMN